MNKSTYEYAVIVGIDGMGNFNKDADTPNMDRIFENGAKSYYALSLYPTISAQNWGGMLLGASPEVHGLTNNKVGNDLYTNTELPSLFTRVRKVFPDAYLASYCNWDPINHGIIEHNIDVDMQTAENDEVLCGKIEECIAKKPKLLFIQFDDVDGAGHGAGYGKQPHLDRITETDKLVQRVYEAYEKAGIIDDTLFTVIADHGGYDHGHGSYTDGERFIFFAAAGKTVKKSEIPYAEAKDINSVILHGFGIDVPEYDYNGYSSRIPSEIFTDCEGGYEVVTPAPFNIITEPTPAIDGKGGLLEYFGKDEMKFALFFDNDTTDALGKVDFKTYGHPKFYTEGRYSSMGELGEIGWLSSEQVKFGMDSFSIGVWLKLDKSLKGNCYVCGTKAMRAESRGFMLSLTVSGSVLSLENDDHETYEEFITPFINDISDGWVHVLAIVDRENKQLRIYHNFVLKRTISLDDCYDVDFDNLPFTVGNECSFKGNNIFNRNIYNLDDLIVFNKALTPEEADKLAKYYKM